MSRGDPPNAHPSSPAAVTPVDRPVEPLDGPDGGPGPTSWPTARRKALREFRRHQCIPDPKRPGKRIHPSAACPHGTEGGYTNWGCECAVVPGTERRPVIEHAGDVITPEQLFWPKPGCEPVGVAAANTRKQRRAHRRARIAAGLPPSTPRRGIPAVRPPRPEEVTQPIPRINPLRPRRGRHAR
jgi:hypothetical protein